MSSSGNLIMHEASRERECETDELGWGQGALVKNTTYLYNSRFLPKYPSQCVTPIPYTYKLRHAVYIST